MTRTTIVNARILEGNDPGGPAGESGRGGAPGAADGPEGLRDLLLGEGRILRISPAGRTPPEGVVIDAEGARAASGYVDIHTHGGAGADVMDADSEGLGRIARFHLSNGTTTFLATTLTAPLDRIRAALDTVRAYRGGGARIAGVHLEGPFLSPANAGAQEKRFLRAPDTEALRFVADNADILRRVTLAPELPGALDLIAECAARGIGVSAGHDASVDDEIEAAIETGLSCVTHIYCCSSTISRRTGPRKHLGLTELGMADPRLAVEVIADGRHVPDALFRLILRAKGRDSICLVSDSIRVAGMPDGEYRLGDPGTEVRVRKEGDEASVPDLGVYAGSVMPLGAMVRRLVAGGAASLEDAVHMASAVPARLAGLSDRGRIAEGLLADINLLAEDGSVLRTFLGGQAT
ncbi:MAG TPA: N-acetylglucosamine-6-phosphate deacetylase [Spirochaetia bacterium]|nr:N-acetylglucosamine-6-phosphate deacetylase [Spirochaetales bacterium]HRY79916.1 N-acetylglucosamine-6-phosphate deacetylase [Spirochaetia bacterium]